MTPVSIETVGGAHAEFDYSRCYKLNVHPPGVMGVRRGGQAVVKVELGNGRVMQVSIWDFKPGRLSRDEHPCSSYATVAILAATGEIDGKAARLTERSSPMLVGDGDPNNGFVGIVLNYTS